MRTVELFRLSSSALTRHKMRAFLTLLGVMIGVASVVGVVSVISGLNTYVKDKLFGLNPDIVIFTKYGIITSREEWLIARKRRDVTLTDMSVVRQECRLCAEVGAEGDRTRPVKFMDRKLSDVQIQGHTANMTSLLRVDVATGRYFTANEYDHAAAVAVIGFDVQDQLFGTMDPIGRIMKIDGYPVKVVGTLVKQGNVMGQSRDNVIYIPLTLFKNHIAPTQDIAIFIKPVGGVEGANAATDEVRTILRSLRKTKFVMVHGGCWIDGGRTDYSYYGVKLAELGYAAATIDYRVADQARYPARSLRSPLTLRGPPQTRRPRPPEGHS